MAEHFDIAIVGAGAAGLMATIWAGRTARRTKRSLRIVALDGARSLGAKILVAGGGRCNVTHHAVDERDFAGSTPAAIRRVLRRFPVDETVRFFEELGVALKREETGKLFPTSDRARSVLDALLRATQEAGAEVRFPWRVESIRPDGGGGMIVTRDDGASIAADRVILATGGCSLPKSGSDGHGHEIARSLGHSIASPLFPALVPLILPAEHPLRTLSGIATRARVEVRAGSGRRLHSTIGSVLCTHFGLSGPAILDISRHLTSARIEDPDATLQISWLADLDAEAFDRELAQRPTTARRPGQHPHRGAVERPELPLTPIRRLKEAIPERLAEVICALSGVEPHASLAQLPKAARRLFARTTCAMQLPIVGDRGYSHAEATAGGVPLLEVDLATMASRRCDPLSLCGEILDVDGRIGGFNFQWAWASGFVAGSHAATPAATPDPAG